PAELPKGLAYPLCAKCKDSFNGTPVNEQQCYRQFNVDNECFASTPTNRNLPKGRTVFFDAQPKFTIDVNFGEVEVYVSNSHDTFIVEVDLHTGINAIKIEDESVARGGSQGLLFLRLDQAHIDLFVVFSVFFSCFFLSVCVLLWKIKQFMDFRREQRRHIQEMTKMASRPFAKLTVYLEPEEPHGYQHFCRSDPFLSQLMGFSYSTFKVGPITLEPTDDGMAGVATVLIQLPGGILAPNRACLGSALVTLWQNLQEYCGHVLLRHQHLTTMAM
uniref:Uncharacterized protein n=1 Tax=Oncorhynchus kisutch TaxID=8019 RepID=A0A8C7G2G8_ONCKI